MDFDALLRANRSYRAFDQRVQVGVQELEEILEAARFAPSAMNQQLLRFRLFTGAEAQSLRPYYAMGGSLPNLELPHEGEEPSAFILIVLDSTKSDKNDYVMTDLGIVAQTLLLKASSMGLGGICLGSAKCDAIVKAYNIDPRYQGLLLIGIGKAMEEITIVDIYDGESQRYYRENGVHKVPKIVKEDLIMS